MKSNQVDPRGPRFGAAITSALMVLVIFFSLDETTVNLAAAIMAFSVVMFIFGSTLGPSRHPYSYLFKYTLRMMLPAPNVMEDSRPVHFAQVVGLIVTGSGLLLHLIAVPYALPIAAAAAFVAAFFNALFAYCLGCQMYLGLKRLGLLRK